MKGYHCNIFSIKFINRYINVVVILDFISFDLFQGKCVEMKMVAHS